MSKRDEIIEAMIEEAKKLNLNISDDLIKKVTVGLGPSIYNKDSASVACGQPKELETVKNNFLKKKLGLELSDEELNKAIKEVCEQLGSSNGKKTGTYVALLAMKFNKEGIYDA